MRTLPSTQPLGKLRLSEDLNVYLLFKYLLINFVLSLGIFTNISLL